MSRPEKPNLLKWLYRLEEDGSFGMRTLLQRGAEAALEKDKMEAEAYAEANVNAFCKYVIAAQDEDERRGLSRVLTVVDPATYVFRWYSESNNLDSRRRRKLLRLRRRPAFLNMIDALTSREYEALACVAMNAAGASKISLTPPGNEGGVDFFALLPTPGKCHLFGGGANPVRVVGQSKKYSQAVQVDKLKEFLTTLQEVKHRGEPKTEKIVPPWFHGVRGPIVGCVIAHSGYQSGATSRARNHGVITADSLDVAEMLAMTKIFPEETDAAAQTRMCLEQLRAYLL
jgi:hypothetical protein